MSTQENRTIVSRFYEEVWNGGDMVAADELIAPTFICRGTRPGEALDREEFKQYISKLRANLNFRHTVEDIVAEGDTVVARLTGHGEVRRKVLGRKQLTGVGVAIWKLSNGQITERWAIWEPA